MNSIDFNGHIFDVHHFTGTVTSLNIRPPIFPVTLKADNGKEHIIRKMYIPSFGCSKGHKLKIIWVEIPEDIMYFNGNYFENNDSLVGDKRIIYVATKNFTTDEVFIADDILGQYYSSSYSDSGCVFFLLALLVVFGCSLFVFHLSLISLVIGIAISVFISIPSYKSSIKAKKFALETKANLLALL